MSRTGRGNVETMVRDYIKKNPELIISMRMGILNVSKLSRKISQEETGYNIISIRSALNKIFMENSSADTVHIDRL
ncbi:aspartate kinase, partial [Ferroplasma acidiphilum]|nr:aspartate kinase [Ferroplasma acidiphilum]